MGHGRASVAGAMSCHVISCHVMSCRAVPGHAVPDHAVPGGKAFEGWTRQGLALLSRDAGGMQVACTWDTGGMRGIQGIQGIQGALVVMLAGHAALRMRGTTGMDTTIGGENAG